MNCILKIMAFSVHFFLFLSSEQKSISDPDLIALREETREAFHHAYNSYLAYGFPFDEVMPISCLPRRYDRRTRGDLDDVLGGYMLSLIDSLDTLIIMREFDMFKDALQKLKSLKLNRNVFISVFEANIRVVGGLLSAHQLALEIFDNKTYDGISLLDSAKDIATRLLPAFNTATGIPVHKVNLLKGKNRQEQRHTCTAAGGTFLLEMGLLSRLTGDSSFELASRKALNAIWDRRSNISLVGSLIDTHSGVWLQAHSGIGAGIDSFYETMLKSSIMLGDKDMLAIFEDAYSAVQKNTLFEVDSSRTLNFEVDMHKGREQPYSYYVSALQAFWPALQVLAGHVSSAKETFAGLLRIWSKFSALPDIYDHSTQSLLTYAVDYPLRPELVESAYYLYGATLDPDYLQFGQKFFLSLQNRSRAACGYASIADVSSGRLDDRMDSYFLAETLKYLYLLFDEGLPPGKRNSIFCQKSALRSSFRKQEPSKPCIHKLDTLFSTEGHLLLINGGRGNRRLGAVPTVSAERRAHAEHYCERHD